LKELEDYEWFPKLWRRYQTDYIGFVVAKFLIYKAFISYISTKENLSEKMFDLCSGSGEPAISIFQKSGVFKHLTLSDKFPQPMESKAHNIIYLNTSHDVLHDTFESGKTYTMFNAIHHFSDVQKTEMIRHLTESGSRAYIVEILQPGIICFFKVFFATTIGTLILTPFIRPFSSKRLFFTYILPINILTITFDGLVSVCKSRTVKQYQQLFQPMKDKTNVFKLKNGFSPLVVIEVKPL